MIRLVIFFFLAAVGARDLQESRPAADFSHRYRHTRTDHSRLSPFGNKLLDGDVSPHLPGEAGERVLMLGQLRVQLCSVAFCLYGDVQLGLQNRTGQNY